MGWSNLSGANFLSCVRRKSIQTDLLSSYDDDDIDDNKNKILNGLST